MSDWAFYALLGVGTGALYAAFAMSVIITYRGSGVVNFAVGALAMIPAMVFAELRRTGDLVLPLVIVPRRFSFGEPMALVPAALLGLLVGGMVSAVTYVGVIRGMRSAPPVTMLVATVGLTLVLQALAVKSFGNVTLRVPAILPDDVISVGGRPFALDPQFLVDLDDHDVLAAAAGLGRPMLVVEAGADGVVGPDQTAALAAAGGADLVRVDGADHLFSRPEHARRLGEIVVEWASRRATG